MATEDDALITAHRLAKRLGVERREVYEWTRGPQPIPSYQVGTRAKRFRWTEVQAWLESRRSQPAMR